MKILNVSHYFLPKNSAGTEVVTYNLSKEFKKNNHQVAVFHGEKPVYQKNLSVEAGFYEDLQVFKVFNDYTHIKKYFDYYKNKKIDKHFGAFLDRYQPDVVHFHHLINLSFGMIDECEKRNIPIYFTLHDFWCQCPQGQRFHDLKKQICYEVDYNQCAVCQGFSSLSYVFNRVRHVMNFFLKRYKKERKIDKEVISFIDNQDKCRISARKRHVDFKVKQQFPYLMIHPNAKLVYSKFFLTPDSQIKFSMSCVPEKKDIIKGPVRISIKFGNRELFNQVFMAEQIKNRQDFCINVDFSGREKLIMKVTAEDVCLNYNMAFYDLRLERPIVVTKNVKQVDDISDLFYQRIKIKAKGFINWLKIKQTIKNAQVMHTRNIYIVNQLKKCQKVICPTPILYNEFQKSGLQNLLLSEDGIEQTFFNDFVKKEHQDQVIRFAYIGSFIPTKGLHVLVDAFNLITNKNIFLDIYGPKDNLTDYTASVVNSVQNPNIEFKGTFDKNEIAKIFQTFDVLIVPSIWFENAPLVIRNSILAKTPMIVSDLGGMSFLCKDSINGLVFKPGDVTDLVDKISKFIENPQLIKQFSSQMPKVKSIEENANELLSYYEKNKQVDNQDTAFQNCDNVARVKVSIVIPTYNGEEFLAQVFDQIKNQEVDFKYEVIIVDSGSTDKTLFLIKKYGWDFFQIDKKEFNHGLTRNFAISKAKGEIIVLLTQDAIPEHKNWLSNIVRNFVDEKVTGVYVRQIPRSTCKIFLANNINNSLVGANERLVNQLSGFEQYYNLSADEKYRVTNFDNVCSAVRRSFWQNNHFMKSNFGEDLRMGIDMILSGGKIIYESDAAVIHSHNRDLKYEYKRSYSANAKLLENYNLVSFKNLKDVAKIVTKNVNADIMYCKNNKFPLGHKIKYVSYSTAWNMLTRYAAYKAYKDWQGAKITNYNI